MSCLCSHGNQQFQRLCVHMETSACCLCSHGIERLSFVFTYFCVLCSVHTETSTCGCGLSSFVSAQMGSLSISKSPGMCSKGLKRQNSGFFRIRFALSVYTNAHVVCNFYAKKQLVYFLPQINVFIYCKIKI